MEKPVVLVPKGEWGIGKHPPSGKEEFLIP